ncbi:hypothetical protein GK2058 [Geobacillus kaustophilus HTA426]|uniref:Uncharacterized protein n=1 Tax=Geobacillus kaustophilus (strain HTA426) TaxID=235909 RepID=Q5KY93_GEOKA|nr:hypothetical protein GK2058 [Geobacillus kaustophilus HTA426]
MKHGGKRGGNRIIIKNNLLSVCISVAESSRDPDGPCCSAHLVVFFAASRRFLFDKP